MGHTPRCPAAAEVSGAVFHGNSTLRWEADTLVVESIGFDERTYIMPNGWFHSDELKVTERYSRSSMNYLIVEITVDDPKVLMKPWKSAPRPWTLGDGEVYEFYCTNNKELEELQKVRELQLQKTIRRCSARLARRECRVVKIDRRQHDVDIKM